MSICPRRCSVFSMTPPGLCSTGRTCTELVKQRIYLHAANSGLQNLSSFLPCELQLLGLTPEANHDQGYVPSIACLNNIAM